MDVLQEFDATESLNFENQGFIQPEDNETPLKLASWQEAIERFSILNQRNFRDDQII